ncbi:MAG TPA: hypothetical protein VMK66_07225 [Myxococcales bacterium]|nr:hypothetical protein [Myxococcales bacterium]
MKRNTRQLLLTAWLVGLTACLDVSFDVDKGADLAIDSAQAAYTGTVDIDFSTNKDFQDHRSNVNGINLEKVTVSITSVNTGNASTKLQSGSVFFRAVGAPADGSQDVKVGDIGQALLFHDYLPVSAGGGGQTYSLPIAGAAAANKFLMDNVVHGAGKFTAVVSVLTDNPQTHMTLHLDFANSLSYGLL